MKKILLALIGLAFAFAMSSCDDQSKRCSEAEKCAEKQERRHRRW